MNYYMEQLGTAVLNFFNSIASAFQFRPDYMMNVLPIMGIGMLGIFIVTGVIIAVVALLNKLTQTKE